MARLQTTPAPGETLRAHCPGRRPAGAVDCTSCRVRHLAVCSALPEAEVEALESVVAPLELIAGSTLVREGDPRRQVYTVTAGALRLVRLLADGRRQIAGFLLPGDFIGLSGATTHRHDIEAITDSTLCRFRDEDMQALRADFPDLERKLLARACTELDAARENLLGLARLNPMERLAAFLLDLAERRARWAGDAVDLVLPMGRADIGDHLGLTIETVSRSFTRLRQQNLIAVPDAHTVTLLDRAGLARLAHGG
ncbi:helix-turn-helix domain-containing protein [Coralloluteibacterium stylophorae]|uniref:CRP-like protein Clp n=1 Tax=Coralloluteibacterium stylophorae TaxID=1776034 RepID=A0A8J7VS71_9GAMM|nr:helix-turn-helix domain-containing protein [Coralloluteibacterium stylophorae]MBS7455896.1 helix-turn-helix domain-containing protein [Coralloluteibacterium stylophorae]